VSSSRRPNLGAQITVVWPTGSVTCLLGNRPMLVGSSQECELRIDEASVSEKHVVIHPSAGPGQPVVVEDYGSDSGTRVSGQHLESREQVALLPGMTVELGKAMLILQPAIEEEDIAPAIVPVPDINSVTRLVDLVAPSNLSIVLHGETGVGKEVTAMRVHAHSTRHAGPFVRINCAAVATILLERELFGHERGAFTGAVKAKVGLIEAGNGGTVLLDEVGEMPLTVQAKLLRVLESREVLRVGGVDPRPIDVRIVAATTHDLPAFVAAGAFRSDLYFRLNGITIRLPPLRERRTEILPLARTFLAQASEGKPAAFTPAALSKLTQYSWPGNVRELRNVVERAVVLSGGSGAIDADHLGIESLTPPTPGSVPPTAPSERPASGLAHGDLKADVGDFERKRIEQALSEARGNQTRAAEILGISRRTLVSRLDAYGMPRPRKNRS
jgi:transcriptional regulator with PAS, ATPase and Fis domain